MQASLFLIVTLMPAPLPAIKDQAQTIWRAHHVAVVPPTLIHLVVVSMFFSGLTLRDVGVHVTHFYNQML